MLNLIKYRIIALAREKSQLIWALVFPIILATLFQVSFGSSMETTELLKEIPVAVVNIDGGTRFDYFSSMMDEI